MSKLWKNGQYINGVPMTDKTLDTTSENPVQNKVIAQEINTINSTLGDKTEASAVSGDTAFSKINSLNNSLTNSGWENIPTNHDYMAVRRFGPLVTLMWWTDDALTANEEIATLPSKYIPKFLNFPKFLIARDSYGNAQISIDTNGKIYSLLNKASGSWVFFCVTYMVE